MRVLTFPHGSTSLSGHLHLPDGFTEDKKYPVLVCVHPGSSVKEQTSGLYARHMAERGYVALAYDAMCWGESGGEPRFAEDPASRVEDVRCAVDFLATLGFVDDQRIGILGVCAGGGYAVNAAMTEHRIKAVGTVVAVNIGAARRRAEPILQLEAIGHQRTLEARGAPPKVVPWLPDSPADRDQASLTELDIYEAVEYYRTPRAQHPNWTNQLRLTSNAAVLAFDAFHLVDELLTQPIQIIVGGKIGAFGSNKMGRELYEKVKSPKDLLVIDGASHYDLYDRPQYVAQAVEKLAGFYGQYL